MYGNDPFKMTGSLIQCFLYCILIGVFSAYVTGFALESGAEYIAVFRISGTVAFAGYGLALLQVSRRRAQTPARALPLAMSGSQTKFCKAMDNR